MNCSVLLVEDEFLLLAATQEDLRDLGYDVTSATSGDEAWKLLDEGMQVDVLITDIRMPGKLSGWELARLAREILPDLRVIYTSGYSAEVHQPVSDSVFLGKPYRINDLCTALARP